ncbi:MFS transporter [Phytohabitans rumicis]
MVLLDVTIVMVALPSIGADLDARTTGLQWMLDGYTLVLSALLLGAGSLGDKFGRRRLYLIGLAGFTLASIVCAAAPSIGVLVAARAVQGAAGALVLTGALSLLVQAYPDPAKRAQMIGLNGAIGGSSIALGPVLGGLLVDEVGWRAIFLINVPIGVFAVWLILRAIPESSDPEHANIDVPGQLLALLLLGSLTYGLITSGEHGWGSPRTVVSLGVAVAALATFLAVEARAARPMLPLGLFTDPRFSVANLAALVLGFGTSGMFVLLSLYLQQTQGRSAIATGLLFLPLTIAICLISPFAGKRSGRRGPFPVMAIGYLVAAAGLFGIALLDAHTGPAVFIPLTVLLGLGMGASITPTQAAAVTALPPQRSGLASATANTSRQVGTTLGIAILGMFIVHATSGHRVGTDAYATSFVNGMHTGAYVAGAVTLATAVLLAATSRRQRTARRA